MRQCPACCEPMNAVQAGSIALEACRICGGFWFEKGQLEKVAKPEQVQRTTTSARGRPGRCKHCGTVVAASAPCPRCQRPAPKCPSCGTAPLAIGNVQGINLDVCLRCDGIFLDAGELQLLAGWGLDVQAIQQKAYRLALRPTDHRILDEDSPEARVPMQCSACNKAIIKLHAFTKDDRIYCGSCCPLGAAPVLYRAAGGASTVATMDGSTSPVMIH